MTEKNLVPAEKYLKSGAHIGTRFKSGDMDRYVFKKRSDNLRVLDVQLMDERIRMAAKFLAEYPKERIVVVSRKLYGKTPANAFAEAIGGKALTSRFVPGTFTNPEGKEFVELSALIVTEPEADGQPIEEAKKLKIPIIALCSTNNSTKNIDLVIPINNKGRKSLALVYFLLAKQILKEKKEIKKDEDFKKTVEEFEYKAEEGKEDEIREREQAMMRERRTMRGRGKGDRERRDGRGERRDSGERQRR